MSMMEAEQAAARQAGPSTTTEAAASEPTAAATLPASMTEPLSNANDSAVPAASGDGDATIGAEDENMDEEDEDEMLRRAMALSRGEEAGEDVAMDDDDDDEEDEEAAIARAIAMSLEEGKEDKDKEAK